MTRTITNSAACVLAASLMLCASVFAAHHSYAQLYDETRVAIIRGVVTQVVWANPHPYIYLDVTDDKGTVTKWLVEGSSVNLLIRDGWSATTVRAGDSLSVCGWPGKPNAPTQGLPPGADSAHALVGLIVSFPDGRKMPFVSSDAMGATATDPCRR